MTAQTDLFGARESSLECILGHPGFFRIERIHSGHLGECPQTCEYDDLPCWRWDVGVALDVGRVSWWTAATCAEAVAMAAEAIRRKR